MLAGLRPSFRRRIVTLMNRARAKGHTVWITDGKRSAAVQRRAYLHWRRTGRNLAGQRVPVIAPPTASKHVMGIAADLGGTPAALRWCGEEWERMGGIWGGRWRTTPEPWHFEDRSIGRSRFA